MRFGTPFIGSRALAGTLDDELLVARGRRGRHRCATRSAHFGLDPDARRRGAAVAGRARLPRVPHRAGTGARRARLPLGIVDAIVGQTPARADLHRRTRTTPARHRWRCGAMRSRRRRVDRRGRAAPRATIDGLVATVGRVDADAQTRRNVIAGTVPREPRRPPRRRSRCAARPYEDLLRRARADRRAARARAGRTSTRLDQRGRADGPGADGAARRGRSNRSGRAVAHRMTSGAGHDAMIVARADAGRDAVRAQPRRHQPSSRRSGARGRRGGGAGRRAAASSSCWRRSVP